MSEPKEDIDLLSQKELEDGELEEGELDEPEFISTIDNEIELINTDIHDDSDVNINDKSIKIKKHKHHKKGLHRKRHINSDEKIDNKWKKSKQSNDEDEEEWSPENTDSKNIINIDSDSYQTDAPPIEKIKDNSVKDNDNVPSLKWGYESDEEPASSKNFNKVDIKQNSFDDVNRNKPKEIILSPVYEETSVEVEIPTFKESVEVSKWNDYDSEDEGKVPTNIGKTNIKSSSFDEPYNNNFRSSKRWNTNYNKNDNNSWNSKLDQKNDNWQSNSPNRISDDINVTKSPVKTFDFDNSSTKINSPVRDKGGWGYSSPQDNNEVSKTTELITVSPKANTDNFGKWGYESPDESHDDSKNWTSKSSPKRNDNSQNWGSCASPKKNDDCPKWGSYNRNDDDNNQKWGSRESPKRNNDDNNQRWGSRDSPKRNDDDNNNNNNNNNNQRWGSRDGSRRNNFRRWGPRDGSRRNNNYRRWGSRDGSQRNNDNNQRWGSSNNGSPQRNNDNNQRWGSSNNGSPQRNNDNNQRWGSSNNTSPQRNNDNKRWGSSNNGSPQRSNDDNKKWGSNNSSPQRNTNENNKWGLNNDSPKLDEPINQDTYDLPQASKWGSYDSDDETPKDVKNTTNEAKRDNETSKWGSSDSPDQNKQDKINKWDTQDSPRGNDVVEPNSGHGKWGAFDSDEEGKAPVKENASGGNNKSGWKSFDSDEDSKGTFNDTENRNDNRNDNRNRGGYNNSGWNRNDRNDFKNDRNDRGNDWSDRNKRWTNRNDNEKRNVCKYFSMGSCRHGDRCTYLHESPNKPIPQEPKKKELCKFYEHQQCYKRANCSYMHEEFPCKLFHAGSKMCPSGDSCKYSHAPLNQETKALLEKYLDEKVDERTDKNGSEWSSIIKKSTEDDIDDDNTPSGFDQPESFFPDTLRYRFPGSHDMMRFPRPWPMMRYGDMSMQVPPQMDFMHRQRIMYDRFQYPMPAGRMFPRGFRGMVPPNMHEGFPNGMPFSMPPMPGNPKLHPGNPSDIKDNFNISDPYIDNLAQLVVGKDSSSSPKRLVDMLDPNMQCEDIDDFSLEIETNNSKKNLASPVIIKSPEIPPGAYVPRTSMNAAQPNVRLGPGPAYGGEQAMLYGGYPSHPGESAMMDYINMSAIHYFHNHTDTMGYDLPWKLLLLEVPIKIPYPLMVIETQDLVHKYTDPRLKGHPSVLNSSNTNEESILHQSSYDFNSISNYGSQLQSPNFITTSSESSETLTPLNDFLTKSDEPESPMFPIGEDIFNFSKNKLETDDFAKKVSDRSYLQDPRFKRKKVVNIAIEPSEME